MAPPPLLGRQLRTVALAAALAPAAARGLWQGGAAASRATAERLALSAASADALAHTYAWLQRERSKQPAAGTGTGEGREGAGGAAAGVVGASGGAPGGEAVRKAEPQRPLVPSKWAANVNFTSLRDGKAWLNIFAGDTYTLAVDVAEKRMAMHTSLKFPWAPAEYRGTPLEWFNQTQLTTADYFGLDFNGEKLDASAYKHTFQDPFGWVGAASFAGKREYNAQTVQVWELCAPIGNFTLLATPKGTPVWLQQNVSGQAGGLSGHLSISYGFNTFLPGAGLPAAWDGFDKDDFLHPKRCPTEGIVPPINLTVFIFHPAREFNMSSQDVADAKGDAMFVCGDLLTNRTSGLDHHYEWITQWVLQVLPVWGQYQNCNGYNPPMCLGAERFYVGHEAPDAIGAPIGGQCHTNPLLGEWFSLPSDGRCADGGTPGDGSCTWRPLERIKTIDSTCLFKQHGFEERCHVDARAPFKTATQLFTRAFASTDPALGGCPPLDAASSVGAEQAATRASW